MKLLVDSGFMDAKCFEEIVDPVAIGVAMLLVARVWRDGHVSESDIWHACAQANQGNGFSTEDDAAVEACFARVETKWPLFVLCSELAALCPEVVEQ